MSVLFVLKIWLFIRFTVDASKTSSCLYSDTKDEQRLSQLCAKIECKKKGFVISHLHAETGHSNTTSDRIVSEKRPENKETCFGETAKFIHQSNDCFWKRKCRLGFPVGIIIRSPLRNQDEGLPKCFGEHATFLCVLNARCSKKSEIIDVSTERCNDGVSTIHKNKGIIRSHPTYPWLQASNEALIAISKCLLNKTIKKQTKVGFYDIDLDYESVIHITTALRTITVNSTHFTSGSVAWDVSDLLIFNSADEFITFKFALEPTTPNRGFLVCFKEGKKTQNKKKTKARESGKDFCVKMMRKAEYHQTVSYESDKCRSSAIRLFRSKRKFSSRGKSSSKRKVNAKRHCCCFPENKQSCDHTIGYARLK